MMEKQLLTDKIEEWINRQPTPTAQSLDISVVVPAFNEQWRLPPTLIDMIDYFESRQRSYEIIVVDDGSADSTSGMVKKFSRIRPNVKLLRVPENHGKGHAVRVGVLNSCGDKILIADADGATPIEEVERLLRALEEGADFAIGSRAMQSSETTVTTKWHRRYLGRLFNLTVNAVLLPGIADTQCGFKLMVSPIAKFLFDAQASNGFSFDVEILYIARLAEIKIAEIPINWTNIPGSKVNLLIDAIKMLRDVFMFRFKHRRISKATFEQFLLHSHQLQGRI